MERRVIRPRAHGQAEPQRGLPSPDDQAAEIVPLGDGRFESKAEGTGIDLTGAANPVTVGLTLGDDGGTATTRAEIYSESD